MNSPTFWTNLLNPDGFMPRRICGQWPQSLIWLHNASDFLIWTAYLTIPCVLGFFLLKRREELPFRSIVLLFGMFIIACGTTHLMEIVMFYNPIYRLAGLIKFITAVVSWATVVALVPTIPKALAMRSPDVLQREIEQKERAQSEILRLNEELEERVQLRTAQLEAANRAKDELLQSEQRAREAAEIASRAKDEFLMTLSHELRTPLNAIQGWASLLSGGRLNPADKQQALEVIDRNVRAQSQLVDDILQVSRIITGKMLIESQPVDLAPILEAARAAVEPSASAKNIQIEVQIESGNFQITGDGARLQQIVWNLLSNAIKFTPRGGTITLALNRLDSFAQIEVSDTGEGIAPEFLPHVFDRFRQADSSSTRRFGGLGLGLAIVRHLTELQGGHVRVASEGLGRGATFSVLLPLRAVNENPALVQETSTEAQNANLPFDALEGLRILSVDDESEARHLVSTILSLHGARTQTASSAREALQILREWKPDILVSDVGMPEENGYQLIAQLRALGGEFERLPALALTAYASVGDRQQALTAGFSSHLAKPVLPHALVREILSLKQPVSGEAIS